MSPKSLYNVAPNPVGSPSSPWLIPAFPMTATVLWKTHKKTEKKSTFSNLLNGVKRVKVHIMTIITWNSNCHSSPSCFGHLNRIQMFPWHCHIRRLVHQAGHPIHSENNVYYKKCDAQQGMHACLYIWPTVPIARIGALPKLYRVGVGWENWYKVLEFGRANDRTNVTFLTL